MKKGKRLEKTWMGAAVLLALAGVVLGAAGAAAQALNQPPEGFVALFNGEDLTGWKGLLGNPKTRAAMPPEQLAKEQAKTDEDMRAHWKVVDGALAFDGKGHSLCTAKDYGDFELLVDWKIEAGGDSGIYLRGSPQVQIWDAAQRSEGSGGLYNNKIGPSKPLKSADRPVGEWSTFRILMIGDVVTVYLNGEMVVDGVIMENYWEREKTIYPTGQIEIQSHGSNLYFRNIYIREIPRDLGWAALFDGKDLKQWEPVGGKAGSWAIEDGALVCAKGGGGWLSTIREYGDYELALEYKVPAGGNSGVFLRTPREGNPAYVGMEIQVLDDYAKQYDNLQPWQYTGSIYDVVAAWPAAPKSSEEWKKRATREAESAVNAGWQTMNLLCKGGRVRVVVNDRIVVDTNLEQYSDKIDKHPGLKRGRGYIGLQYHGEPSVKFRNIRVRELGAKLQQ